jgi:hypothetical protein
MKKTILLMTIVAFLIGLYRWLTSDNEEKQLVEETKAATSEKENVNGKAEEATTEDTVENHK